MTRHIDRFRYRLKASRCLRVFGHACEQVNVYRANRFVEVMSEYQPVDNLFAVWRDMSCRWLNPVQIGIFLGQAPLDGAAHAGQLLARTIAIVRDQAHGVVELTWGVVGHRVLAAGVQAASVLQAQVGVKAEEIKWSGLDDFLLGKKRVSKQEVLEFLRQNIVDVDEVLRGRSEDQNRRSTELSMLRAENDRLFGVLDVGAREQLELLLDKIITPHYEGMQEAAESFPEQYRARARRFAETSKRLHELEASLADDIKNPVDDFWVTFHGSIFIVSRRGFSQFPDDLQHAIAAHNRVIKNKFQFWREFQNV